MRRWFSRSLRILFRNHRLALFLLILLFLNSRVLIFRTAIILSDYRKYSRAAEGCAGLRNAAPGQPFLPGWNPPSSGDPPGAAWLMCAPLAVGRPFEDYPYWFRVEMALLDL